jgi:hypothetical protein
MRAVEEKQAFAERLKATLKRALMSIKSGMSWLTSSI